jgi:CheY-like chemotaxis protein
VSKEDEENSLKGKRILICEDNNLNLQIETKLLERKEMIVECAENGQIGLEKFSNNPENYFDAILMDVRMPVMGGIDATKAIRALKKSDASTIPIIAMTANAFDEDVKASKEAGMNAHLQKPIDVQLLYKVLYKYTGGGTTRFFHSKITQK